MSDYWRPSCAPCLLAWEEDRIVVVLRSNAGTVRAPITRDEYDDAVYGHGGTAWETTAAGERLHQVPSDFEADTIKEGTALCSQHLAARAHGLGL